MANKIEKFKSLKTEEVFRGLSKTYSTQKTAYGDTGGDEILTWYVVDRASTLHNTDDMKNLFMSFGLARDDSSADWSRAFDWIDNFHATRMLIGVIPQTGCGSYIDGSTLEINVPTGAGATQFFTFYGASYRGYPDPETGYEVSQTWDDTTYGGASIFLFPDTRQRFGEDNLGEHPYTGSIDGELHPNSGLSAWSGANLDSDTFYPHLRATHWNRSPDSGYDSPYGIALLEKGIFILFDHPGRDDFVSTITGGSFWVSGGVLFAARTLSGGTEEANDNAANLNAIRFTGATAQATAKVTYRTITEQYKTIYFCHAGQNEFNSSSNHTYGHRKAYYRPEEADSVYITEVGLYDDDNNLLAYGKLSEPVEKNKLETITLKVELQI